MRIDYSAEARMANRHLDDMSADLRKAAALVESLRNRLNGPDRAILWRALDDLKFMLSLCDWKPANPEKPARKELAP